MPGTRDMSESSSFRSAKLVSLACSLSGLGIDAANGGVVNPPDNDEPPPPVRSSQNANTHILQQYVSSGSTWSMP